MENDFINRKEHEEFARRQDEENRRQNRRIDLLEQEKQGERLETLESRDGEMWRKVVSHVVTTVVGAVVCYFFMQVGIG